MKTILTALAFVLNFSVFAQSAVDAYYQAYTDDDRLSHVSISAKMFELFTHIEGDTPEEKEILEAISKLKGMKLIAGQLEPDEGSRWTAPAAEIAYLPQSPQFKGSMSLSSYVLQGLEEKMDLTPSDRI